MHIALSILGIILFISLILVHEWGHYKAARRNNVDVEEFGLGFPPRAGGKKLKSGMILSLNWLPLGGFVKLKGEHDADKGKGTYGAASLGAKTKIMLAGVTMNFIVGVLMLSILAVTGMPKLLDNQFTVASDTKVIYQQTRIGLVDQNSPADKAGLKDQDAVMAIRCDSCQPSTTVNIDSAAKLRATTKSFAGQKVTIYGERDGVAFTKTTQLNSAAEVAASQKTDKPQGYFGVVPIELEQRRSTWSAPVVAIGLTAQLTKLTVQGIMSALDGLAKTVAGLITVNTEARQNGQAQATEQTGGIVAIANILWQSGSLGLSFILVIIAVLSLTLAIMNILPIPALDGGRLFVTYLFRILKKPLTPSLEERIHGTGMAVLLILFALITIVDVKRFY